MIFFKYFYVEFVNDTNGKVPKLVVFFSSVIVQD